MYYLSPTCPATKRERRGPGSQWSLVLVHDVLRRIFVKASENLLMVADSEHDSNMLYAVGMFVPDPFIYLRTSPDGTTS